MSGEHPNPWAGAVITKLTPIRAGQPLAFFDERFPLLEATLVGCTLRRTRLGRLWCSPPKLRRQLPDGTTQYDDIVVGRWWSRVAVLGSQHRGDQALRTRAADTAARRPRRIWLAATARRTWMGAWPMTARAPKLHEFQFAPRALPARKKIPIEVTPLELHRLIRSIEAEAMSAIDEGKDGYADFLFVRVAELREAGR
jgi:hypothetical protein